MFKPIVWNQLRDKTFNTITGTAFTVTNVTRKSVIIRPEHGSRDYDLSISNELERGLNALLAGDFLRQRVRQSINSLTRFRRGKRMGSGIPHRGSGSKIAQKPGNHLEKPQIQTYPYISPA